MAIAGLLLVLFCNRIIFPRPRLVRIESFLGDYFGEDLYCRRPTDPVATLQWILITGVGVSVCLSGVWLYLKARRAQQAVSK